MPQANNPQVRRDMELSPVGPGTVFSRLAHMSKVTRERANLVNKTEQARLSKIERLIEKEHRFSHNHQNKVIERTTKTLKEKQALLKILGGEYRVANFVTMQQGFDSNQIETRDIARRYVMESRIFHTGFNVKALRPEVHRQIRKLDPNHKYKKFKKGLLANYKSQNIEINRVMSDGTFYDMLGDQEHWKEYNDPARRSNRRHVYSDANSDTLKQLDETDELVNESGEKGVVKRDAEGKLKDVSTGEDREKSVVIERRLPKRQNAAYSMTMRTLGPVYFQASVQNVAADNPEVEVVGAQ